ncbi:DnaJ subfamily C member 17 [Rhypophila decipiens]|uniref:DnaJ subfamily C member 17 n=1 Tax=Rhypophila decipiens TaxID=261697 RepID=A0AAN6Y973_9PEZI|nr:DnaJ subfamily C member 17 [Rhypophila decipiens]
MPDEDLITYASACASRNEDLFALLSVDATASESEIRRAFRKKALTAHPDKAGSSYDPALYTRLEKARDVLISPEAREAYQNGMRAILQKQQAKDAMSARQRRFAEDLEAREQAAAAAASKKQKTGGGQQQEQELSAELQASLARGRAILEERNRKIREAEERERLRKEREDKEMEEKEADLERRLKEIERRKAEKKKLRKADKKDKKNDAKVELSGSRGASPPPLQAGKEEEGQTGTAAPPTDNEDTAPGGGGFPALMARLKAAQAKKEEEKKRRAMEEAMKA